MRVVSFRVFVKPDPLLDCYGARRRAVIKVHASGVWGTAVCFRLESLSRSPAVWVPPKRKEMSNLNTNGRQQGAVSILGRT